MQHTSDFFAFFSTRRVWISFLLFGIFLRIANAVYNFAPVAIDDYFVLEPALYKIQTLEAIDTENYRMRFITQWVYIIMLPLHKMGVTSPAHLVSFFYSVMGMLSLIMVWGGFRLAQNFSSSAHHPYIVLALFSLHFIFPFISTKAYIESLSMFFIPFAFYFFTKPQAQPRDYFWGSFWLAFSCLFRFQNGILVIVTFSYILYEVIKRKKTSMYLAYFLLAGFLNLVFMGIFDLSSGRFPLSTIYNYIVLNFDTNVTSQIWGSSPWYNYIGILLLVFIPPFSLILLQPFIKGIRMAPLLSWNFFIFVIFHSLIANKLERFLFPVLPLFIILTVIGLPVYNEAQKKYRLVKNAFWAFFIFNIPLLLAVTFSRSQMNVIQAASYMYKHPQQAYYFYGSLEFWVQGYYGYQYPPLATIAKEELPHRLKEFKNIYILSYEKSPQEISQHCRLEEIFAPDFSEKIIIRLNPQHNKRRDTLYLHHCQ